MSTSEQVRETPEEIMRDALVLIAQLAPATSTICDIAVKALARANAREAALTVDAERAGTALRAWLVAQGFTEDEIDEAGPVSTALLERCKSILAARAGEKGEAA